ncbi:MAG: aminopeptidase N C-terminal domain-containing protein [Gammaproteobacteria bacterium]|nr:aminopeptidase N C-terminal domain-containing protein [Gammaproteobacteria bacterium]
MLSLPGETYIAEQLDVIDPDAVVGAHKALKQHLAQSLGGNLKSLYESLKARGAYRIRCREYRPPAAAVRRSCSTWQSSIRRRWRSTAGCSMNGPTT